MGYASVSRRKTCAISDGNGQRRRAMDYDVVVIGSGFGGAITGCRLAEAGYRVLILERGRRWSYEEKNADFFPRKLDDPDRWLWSHTQPEVRHGWLDLRVFPNMAVAQGAGVGG